MNRWKNHEMYTGLKVDGNKGRDGSEVGPRSHEDGHAILLLHSLCCLWCWLCYLERRGVDEGLQTRLHRQSENCENSNQSYHKELFIHLLTNWKMLKGIVVFIEISCFHWKHADWYVSNKMYIGLLQLRKGVM